MSYDVMSSRGDVIQSFRSKKEARGFQQSIRRGVPRKRDSFGNVIPQTLSEKPRSGTYIREVGNPRKARVKSTTLRNMAVVTVTKLSNGVVKITGRKMAGKRNPGGMKEYDIFYRRGGKGFAGGVRASSNAGAVHKWVMAHGGRSADYRAVQTSENRGKKR